jgi:hypothetical protein
MSKNKLSFFSTDLFFRSLRNVVKSDYWLRHICLSVRLSLLMEHLGSQWADFRKIL